MGRIGGACGARYPYFWGARKPKDHSINPPPRPAAPPQYAIGPNFGGPYADVGDEMEGRRARGFFEEFFRGYAF